MKVIKTGRTHKEYFDLDRYYLNKGINAITKANEPCEMYLDIFVYGGSYKEATEENAHHFILTIVTSLETLRKIEKALIKAGEPCKIIDNEFLEIEAPAENKKRIMDIVLDVA